MVNGQIVNEEMKQIQIRNTDALPEAARQFVNEMGAHRVFAFYGDMGAGKTTFIRAVCEALGVRESVTSPTFAIVNEYKVLDVSSGQGLADELSTIYHFDFYRIRRLSEAYDMGFEDYLYSGHICCIEWPQIIEELLPDDAVYVQIRENPEDGSRTITF